MIAITAEFNCEDKNHLSNLEIGILIIDLDLRSVKHLFNQNYELRQLHNNSGYPLEYISLWEQPLSELLQKLSCIPSRYF